MLTTDKKLKNKIIVFIKCVIFFIILGLVLFVAGRLFERKTSRFYKESLFEEYSDADVLLVGSSHMHNGIYPYYLWKDYGITSYNFATSGEHIDVTYYMVKEALKSVKPKAIVVDLFVVPTEKKEALSMGEGFVHEAMDFMPLSKDKMELAAYAAKSNDRSILAFLSNIYAYHSRWKELTKDDFVKARNKENGAQMLAGVRDNNEYVKHTKEYNEEYLEGTGYEYLGRIFDLCDENGVECILVNIPYPNQTDYRQSREYTYMEAAKKRGVKSLNMSDIIDDMGIDMHSDYVDNSHVNIVGAKKVSDALGEFLKNDCDILDRSHDSSFEHWNNLISGFEEARFENADDAGKILPYMMCFYDDEDYYVELYTKDGALPDDFGVADYIDRQQIRVGATDDVDDLVKEYMTGLIPGTDEEEEATKDDFAFVLIRKRLDNSIVAGKAFEYVEGGYHVI